MSASQCKPITQQYDKTLPALANLSAPRCYYCYCKFMHPNDILAHLSDDHPTKDIIILKPYCVPQTGRIRYRTQRYGIRWHDVTGGASSLILMPHSWLLVGREDLKKVDHADSGVGPPRPDDGSQLSQPKRSRSDRTKHVCWRTKVENKGATLQITMLGKIHSSPQSGVNAARAETCKPEKTAVNAVSTKPVTAAEMGRIVSVVSSKPGNKAEKGRPASVISGKQATTTKKGRPAGVMFGKPVTIIGKDRPSGVMSGKPASVCGLPFVASVVSGRWDEDATLNYNDITNFVSPRTMSPQCMPSPIDSGTSTGLLSDKQTSTTTFDLGSTNAATATEASSDKIRQNTVDNSTSTIPGYDVTRDGSIASGVYFSEDTSRQFSPDKDVPPPRKCRTTSGRYVSNDLKVQLPDSVVRGLENMSVDTVNPAKCLLARGTSLTDKKVCSEVDIPMLSRVLLANAVRAGESEQTTAPGNVISMNCKYGADTPVIRTSDNQTDAVSQFWKEMNSERLMESLRAKQHVTHVGHSQSQKNQSLIGATDDRQSDDCGGLTTWAWEESRVMAAGSTDTIEGCPFDEPDTGETSSDITLSEPRDTRDIQNPDGVKYDLGCEQENVRNTKDKFPLGEKRTQQHDVVLCSLANKMSWDSATEEIETYVTTLDAPDSYPAIFENAESESADDDSICHCCGVAEQFMYKKLSTEPEDDDVTAIVDGVSDSQAMKWLFREDDDDDDVTIAEPTPTRFFEMDDSIANEMVALFPSVVPLLRSAGRLADWVRFMQVVSDDRCFPPSDDVRDMLADIRRWQTSDPRAYTDGQKRFWSLGNRLFRAHSDFQANKADRQTERSWDTFDE